MLSCAAVPDTQMNPFESAMTVCSAVGHSGMVSGPAPGADDGAFLIQLDDLRSADAAVDPVLVAADLVRVGRRRPVDEPDVIVLRIDADPGDLLHAPAVGEPLGPERIDLEHRRGGRPCLRARGGRCASLDELDQQAVGIADERAQPAADVDGFAAFGVHGHSRDLEVREQRPGRSPRGTTPRVFRDPAAGRQAAHAPRF